MVIILRKSKYNYIIKFVNIYYIIEVKIQIYGLFYLNYFKFFQFNSMIYFIFYLIILLLFIKQGSNFIF